MPVVTLLAGKPYTIAGIATQYDGFSVQNQGSTTVYFSQLPNINPDLNFYDYSVAPGGGINWPADEPCFVTIKTADQTGLISYAPLVADQHTSSQVSGTVTISGTPQVSVPGGVAINGTPNVAIPGGVGITGTPNVAIPAGVAINGTPNVAIPGGVGVTGAVFISGTPTVAVPGGVAITGTPNVAITGTPTVAVPSGVSITGTPNVAIPGGVGITGTPNVAIPGGVGVTGTVGINQQSALLATWTGALFGSTIFDSSALGLDLTKLSSIRFTMDTTSAFGAVAATPSVITVAQKVGGILIGSKNYSFFGSGGIDTTFAVLGDEVIISIVSNVGGATTYVFSTYGFRVLQPPITKLYPMPGGGWYFVNYNQINLTDFDGFKGIAGTIGTAAQSLIYPPSSTGDMLFGVLQGAINTNLFYNSPSTGSGRIASWAGTQTTSVPTQLSLGAAPIVFATQSAFVAGANMYFSMEQQHLNSSI